MKIDKDLLKAWLEAQINREVENLKHCKDGNSCLASMAVGAVDAYRQVLNHLEGEYPDE